MIEDALEVATDPDYRFDLAIQLGRLEVAKVSAQVHIFLQGYIIWLLKIDILGFWVFAFLMCMSLTFEVILRVMFIILLQGIATEVQSESKWKQLGELAMSTGKVFFSIKWVFMISLTFGLITFPNIVLNKTVLKRIQWLWLVPNNEAQILQN